MLHTDRLHVLRAQDVSAHKLLDYERHNREYFEPWVPLRDESWFSIDAQKRRLESEERDLREGRSYRYFLALRAEPATIIGDIGLSNIVRGAFHSAYLGYKLAAAYQRQGLMREAAHRVIRYGFDGILLHRIEANIMPRNTRSLVLVNALGFSLEGFSSRYLCINGEWEDHLRFALLSEVA